MEMEGYKEDEEDFLVAELAHCNTDPATRDMQVDRTRGPLPAAVGVVEVGMVGPLQLARGMEVVAAVACRTEEGGGRTRGQEAARDVGNTMNEDEVDGGCLPDLFVAAEKTIFEFDEVVRLLGSCKHYQHSCPEN